DASPLRAQGAADRARRRVRSVELPAEPAPLTLDLERTALIVVDMQNAFASPGGMLDLAGLDIGPARDVIANARMVCEAARGAGGAEPVDGGDRLRCLRRVDASGRLFPRVLAGDGGGRDDGRGAGGDSARDGLQRADFLWVGGGLGGCGDGVEGSGSEGRLRRGLGRGCWGWVWVAGLSKFGGC